MAGLVRWADANRVVALALMILLMAVGVLSALRLPIDAVPDVTNIQVQVVTRAPALSAPEIEQMVTLPVERAMAGLPALREVRSITKFGLSLVTLVFHDNVDIYFARQLVNERLVQVREEIPSVVGRPELGPIATGLGEIYMFELRSASRSADELRTMIDWDVGVSLRQVPGVIEVVGFGGSVRQYQVTLDPMRMHAHGITLADVFRVVESDNRNTGGGYIERAGEQVVIRGEARFRSIDDLREVVIKADSDGTPVRVGQVARVTVGSVLRQGAMTRDGRGEVVGASVWMLKGENSVAVVGRVGQRINEIRARLPRDITIETYYDRASFIDRTLATVKRNLTEGALLVTLTLVLTLGSLRAGLVVSGAIPFSMLFAFIFMGSFGVSGNLMSLGAVDFGIIVDGAVVMIEHVLHEIAHRRGDANRRATITHAAAVTARPVVFSVVIVLLVFLPLASLEDVEGKMFRPLVVALALMLAGAVIYCLLVVPAIAPMVFSGAKVSKEDPWLARTIRKLSDPLVVMGMRRPAITLGAMGLVAAGLLSLGAGLGAEFLPRIDEGSLAIDARRLPSTSLTQAIELSRETERALRDIPEVESVVCRIGRPEGAVDPAGPESSDIFVNLKPRAQWRHGLTRERLIEEMSATLGRRVPATLHAFSQPIEMRVNDLIAGVKSDVAVKVFGDDLTALENVAARIRDVISRVPGAADVKVEFATGLPELRAVIDRPRAARYGVRAESVLQAIEASRGGIPAGRVLEGQRVFDLVIRAGGESVRDYTNLEDLPVEATGGGVVPLGLVANITQERGVFQISRERMQRRLVVESNVRGRDLVGFVGDAQRAVAQQVQLPPGVTITWGGQFENFSRATARLSLLVPIAFGILAVMLFFALGQLRLVATALLSLPFALAGGVLGLRLAGLPFSIPAGVGFIALSGVAVMSAVVLCTRWAELPADDASFDRVLQATRDTLRARITAALVPAIGFVPMVISTGAGAEVQKPLAVVVIGGLAVSLVLGLVALPVLLLVLSPAPEAVVSPADELELANGNPH